MKRIVSSLLCLVLLIGCLSTAVFASSEPITGQDETVLTQDETDRDQNDADQDQNDADQDQDDTDQDQDDTDQDQDDADQDQDDTDQDQNDADQDQDDADQDQDETDGDNTVQDEIVFTDITSDKWYYEAVMYCYENKLMNGMTDTEFSPNSYGTRAQVVTVLYRLAGEPDVTGNGDFPDVPEDKWYTAAVAWAKENDITTGYEDGTFRPDRQVTRQEFITFLYRYLVKDVSDEWETSTASSTFSDNDKVQSWAQEATNWSIITGLQQGYEEDGQTYLRPDNPIRRSEIATFLYRCRTTTEEEEPTEQTIAEALIGQPAEALYTAIGEPDSSQYTDSCLVNNAEDGLLYYGDFIVATLRYTTGSELVISVY